MTILLTGGTGNTATALARLLKAAGVPFLATSRKAKQQHQQKQQLQETDLEDVPVAELDYSNPETFDKPFQFQHSIAVSSSPTTTTTTMTPIHAIYIVIPGGADINLINAFIDHASKKRNVSKFVLLGGQGADIDADFPPCKVWRHLDSLVGVDYAVLQPSWFNENLFHDHFVSAIKEESKIYSAIANGKIAFVAVEDIVAVAFALLVNDQPLQRKPILVIGPELLTYDELAERFSENLGRRIEHVQVSETDRPDQLVSFGLPEARAKFLTFLEVLVSKSMGEIGYPSENVKFWSGREPQSIVQWIDKHRHYFT